MAANIDDNLSDDEIFYGKISIKEINKHLQISTHRHSITCSISKGKDDNNCDNSFKLIETCSEPDYKFSGSFNDSLSSFSNEYKDATNNENINSADNSFLEMEKIVNMQSSNEPECLDNTLDAVDYILSNATRTGNLNTDRDILNTPIEKKESTEVGSIKKVIKTEKVTNQLSTKNSTEVFNNNGLNSDTFAGKVTEKLLKTLPNKTKVLSSLLDIPQKPTNFKTPKTPLSVKKRMNFTPNKTNRSYQYVTSPVAAYINCSPQIPKYKNIKHKPSTTRGLSIPKPLKAHKTSFNKENVSIPSIAYKSSKNMKVINEPNDVIFPVGQKTKQICESLPKPLLTKHVQREHHLSKKSAESQLENSFANLTLNQADVSVCTQKIVYNLKGSNK